MRQLNEYGLMEKVHVVGGMTALDEAVLRNMGDEALGILTACWYSAELDNPENKKFAPAFRKDASTTPAFMRRRLTPKHRYWRARSRPSMARSKTRRRSWMRCATCKVDTVRGPVAFDEYGNIVGNVYIRKVERKDGRLVNAVIYTYPNVSQFWTYDPKAFLKNPVYSRDWPPAKYLEP